MSALVGIAANAICDTDRDEYYNGSSIVPGHEAAGRVIAAGPGTSTPSGTRGVIYLMDYCALCRSCLIGATNQRTVKRADVGQTSDGGYGPYALAHETSFFPVGDDLALSTATMLLDVTGICSHALRRAALVNPDIESIYIAGAGPIGLGLLAMARIRYGADFPVHISDISPWRREFAVTFGATALDPADEPAALQVRPDVAFDSTGKGVYRRLALSALGQRGALVCVGHGQGLQINVSADLIAPERAISGSEYFRFDQMADNLTLLTAHHELISRVIINLVPVRQIAGAFALLLSRETGKVVVAQEVDS